MTSDTPGFRKPEQVVGTALAFRLAQPTDAEFILSLRLDPQKGRYLSPTDASVEQQASWLRSAALDPSQVYFIIETVHGKSVGAVRLYDPRQDSFCWGSWVLAADAPKSAAVESTLMVYSFALDCGFTRSHFDVRRGNEKVWQYHERLGAQRVGKDKLNYYYEMSETAIRDTLARYSARIAAGVRIFYGV